MKGEVPEGVLDAILKEAAAPARVAREQLVIARAEPVVWKTAVKFNIPEAEAVDRLQDLIREHGNWVDQSRESGERLSQRRARFALT